MTTALLPAEPPAQTCTHTRSHTHTHILTWIPTHAHTQTQSLTLTNTYALTFLHYTHTYTHSYADTHLHIHILIDMHAYTCTNPPQHTHRRTTYTHAHTQTCLHTNQSRLMNPIPSAHTWAAERRPQMLLESSRPQKVGRGVWSCCAVCVCLDSDEVSLPSILSRNCIGPQGYRQPEPQLTMTASFRQAGQTVECKVQAALQGPKNKVLNLCHLIKN